MADTIDLSRDPPPEVRRYFAEKGLRPAFNWQDVWGDEHAHAFTVAKAMELDVLSTIQGSLQDAIDDGVPFQAWAADLTPRLQSLGWWGEVPMTDPQTGETRLVRAGSPRRLQTIYQANMRTARAAGQWERAQRTKAGLPYFLYGLSIAENKRPEHQAKVGTILPVDDPFWDTWFPPNGWGCKCWVRQITRREAERLGGETARPDVPTRPFVNQRTGEVTQIPVGIDPGWHTNPGKARSRNVASFLTGKLDDADADLRRIAIADIAGSSMMRELVAGRFSDDVRLPIGEIINLGAPIFLSGAAVRASANQSSLSAAQWAAIVEQLNDLTYTLDGDGNRVYQVQIDGRSRQVRITSRDGLSEVDVETL